MSQIVHRVQILRSCRSNGNIKCQELGHLLHNILQTTFHTVSNANQDHIRMHSKTPHLTDYHPFKGHFGGFLRTLIRGHSPVQKQP